MRPALISRLLILVTSSIVLLGFILHTSDGVDLVFGKYTTKYFAFLALLSLVWVSLIAWAWKQREKLTGILQIAALNALFTFLLLGLVAPPVFVYLHQVSLKESLLRPLQDTAHSFFQIDMAPSLDLNADRDKVRILVLGGSTTYGSNLARHQAYPAVLEKILNERYSSESVVVFNAGVPWHTSMHSLLRYVAVYSGWKPDIVIVMHAFNDIFQTSEGRLTSGHFREDYGHFFGPFGPRVNPRDHFFERSKSLLFDNWFSRTWYSDIFPQSVPAQRREVDLCRALPSFRRQIMELAKRAHDDGADVVLLTQPNIYREDMTQSERDSLFYDYYYKDYAIIPTIEQQAGAMDAFNETTRDVAAESDLFLIDLAQLIPKSSAYFYDDVHYTIEGAELVARTVASNIPLPTPSSD